MRTLAVVTAAGEGLRMGTGRAKQFLDLCGRPILAVTLVAFERSPAVHEVNLVVPESEVDYCRKQIVQRYGLEKVRQVLAGGRRRQDSVRLGLEASAGAGFEFAMIHDGVRPLLKPELIQRISNAVKEAGAVIAALPAKDTVKEVDKDRLVRKTCDRRFIWLVQTPQAFRYEEILKAHRKALEEGWDEVTDDALLMEKTGIPVYLVEGEEDNIKVTTPYDLELARFLLKRREE
jgi:2-C-methyl-D-erythritol 4-phosphate cytidylyltransferase